MLNTTRQALPVILALSLVLTTSGEPGKGLALHVAPTGDDANPGTLEKPLKTLEAARDNLRAARPGPSAANPAKVYLHPGTYRRTETFELGPRDSYATYKSLKSPRLDAPAPTRLVGGVEIPGRAVKAVTDAKVLDRIVEKEARPHLRQIDLKAMGITDYGVPGPRGFRRAYIPAPLELFIDGAVQDIARWPNAGELHIPMGKVIPSGSKPRFGDYSGKVGTFAYGIEHPVHCTQARDFYVSGIFSAGFADDTIRMAKPDTQAGTFTLAHPHIYGLANRSFTTWYALNLLEKPARSRWPNLARRGAGTGPAGYHEAGGIRDPRVPVAGVDLHYHVRHNSHKETHTALRGIVLHGMGCSHSHAIRGGTRPNSCCR